MFKRKDNKDQLIIIDGNKVYIEGIYKKDAETIETERSIIPTDEVMTFVNDDGGLTYIAHLSIPAKIEAEKLRDLRRSVALKQVFEFDRDSNFDIFKFVPYIIILLLIIF